MNIQEVLFMAFISIGLFYMLHMGMYVVGANIYDMKRDARKRKYRLGRLNPGGRKPTVTVIVPAHNEEKVIERTLTSICQSNYKNFDIVVVDDGSTDGTARIVRNYIRRRQRKVRSDKSLHKINIKLVCQKNAGKGAALNNAIAKHAKGNLVMCLDADSLLHEQAIANAVWYFRDREVAAVAANVRIMDEPTVLGLLQKFEHMIGYNSKKFHTVINAEYIVGGVASTYRRSVLDKVNYYDTDTMTEDIGLSMKVAALGNKRYKLVYGYDVVAMTEGVSNFQQLLRQRYRWKMGSLQNVLRNKSLIFNTDKKYSRMLTMYRMPMAVFGELLLLAQPLLLTYVVYLTFVFGSPRFFVGAYIVATIYVLWNILPDEHASWRRKFAMSSYAPAVYFVFYIMDFIQTVSIARCLAHPKTLFGNTDNHTTWVSPERRGNSVTTIS